MKCISLWQPWASLWCSPRKVHETRHWPTKHRGPLAVHAAKRIVRDIEAPLQELLVDEYGGHWAMDLPQGAIIGVVDVVECVEFTPEYVAGLDADDILCGNFAHGRFGYRRGSFRLLDAPIPFIGRQGLFNVPDALLVLPQAA